MLRAEALLRELEPMHFTAEHLDALTVNLRGLGEVWSKMPIQELVWLLPVRPEELTRLTITIARAEPGEATPAVALIVCKFAAINKYFEFTTWFAQDFAPMLTRRIELAQAGERVTPLKDHALRDALAARDAQAVAELFRYYIAARHAFRQRHMVIDEAAQRAYQQELGTLPKEWLDAKHWETTFDLLALDLTPYLPALPAQAD